MACRGLVEMSDGVRASEAGAEEVAMTSDANIPPASPVTPRNFPQRNVHRRGSTDGMNGDSLKAFAARLDEEQREERREARREAQRGKEPQQIGKDPP